MFKEKTIVGLMTAGELSGGGITVGKELHTLFLRYIAAICIIMGTFFSFVFGPVAFFRTSELPNLIFESVLLVISLVALYKIWKGRNLMIFGVLIPMTVFGFLFGFLWYLGDPGGMRGIWILILPMINIALGGCSIGLAYTIMVYIFMLLVAMIDSFGYQYPVLVFAKYSCVYWTIAVLSYVFEYIRGKADDNINYLNRVISNKDKLIDTKEISGHSFDVYSKIGFIALGDLIWKQAVRDKICMSVLMVGVDNFEDLNKRYGAWACEDVLRGVAEIIRSNVRRPLDVIGKHRPGTYAVLLYSAGEKPAANIAENICADVKKHKFKHDDLMPEISASVSIGVACVQSSSKNFTFKRLIENADKNLKTAERTGAASIFASHEEEEEKTQ